MNERSDINRVLAQWFDDGPSVMPDRVVDVVADRIAHERQRPAWLHPWRPQMNRTIKFGAAAAAVILVALVGWNLLPGRPAGIGGPAASPTAAPTAMYVPALPDGTLKAGTYRLRPLASVPTLSIDAEVPDGWGGVPDWALIGPGPGGTEGPGGFGIVFLKADGLFSDPCHWDVAGDAVEGQPGDVVVGPTVDDLAAALAASSAYESTTPIDVTLGGFRGKQLDLQLPTDIAGCDTPTGDKVGAYYVFSGPGAGLYPQGPDNRWSVSIVDVAGTRLIAVVVSYAATPTADMSAARAILDSLVITP